MLRLIVFALALVAAAAAGLYFYGMSLEPVTKPVEKVIPDARFAK